MGKATEFVQALRGLSPPEEAQNPRLPALRLRTDTPSVEVGDQHGLSNAISDLDGGRPVVVHEIDGQPAAVVITVERYLQLAGIALATGNQKEATNDSRVVPTETALTAAGVEQVDPNASWT